jgi:Fibronectin type III domain
VHLTGSGDFQSSSARAATSGNAAPGQSAFTSVHTGTSPSGVDAVVVQNNNGGSGSYTLYRDTKAPSGTITVNSGAAFTGNTHATLTLSATNPTSGDPVSDMRFSSDGTTFGPWMPFAASASFTLAAGNGTRTVSAQFRNAAGAISPTVSDSITLDTTRPVITKAPAPSFQKVQLGTTAVPILIKWAGTDGTSGIAHFDLQRSADGGAFSTVASPTTAQASVNLNPGHSYRFRVRATDNAGNKSGFTASRAFTLSAFQETDGAITYSSGWSRQAVTGAYGGSVGSASAAGETATFSFAGSQVAWVSTEGADRGSATVKLDAGTAATVSTNKATILARTVVSTRTVTAGAHTLRLKVLGTSGHPRVDVDAFLVIS